MRIDSMNWGMVEQYLAHDDRCVLPLGCTEQHAYLSLATDTILADRVAFEAAEPLGIPVFPCLPYGLTPSFGAYPGTLTLTYETYGRVIQDLLESIFRQGFRRILIVNGHGGNTPARACVIEWLYAHPGAEVQWHDWWNAPQTLAEVRRIDPNASHASWMENFPWTRLNGVESPDHEKPLFRPESLRSLDVQVIRDVLQDGNFGGRFFRPDEDVLALWEVAIAETRALLTEGWKPTQ